MGFDEFLRLLCLPSPRHDSVMQRTVELNKAAYTLDEEIEE
jgi:hypothetical protein